MEERDSETRVAVVAEPPKPAPRITAQAIQERKQQILLLQGMVKGSLIPGVDYGRIPGTPADSLWDPGASQIIAHFNCYPGQRRFLKFEDTPDKISICVEVPMISRETGEVATTGIGACSNLETKYKYRWVSHPEEWGYDQESMKLLKTRRDKGWVEYRIPNPEHSELLNTVVKMASKRAEVDAAESLPGVASALRQMFTGKAPSKDREAESPVWTAFWGEVRRLGLTDEEAHAKLGVTSMKDWLKAGRSLKKALDILRGGQPKGSSPEAEVEIIDPATEEPPEDAPAEWVIEYDVSLISNKTAFDYACRECFRLQPRDALRITNNSDVSRIKDWGEEFRKVAVAEGARIVAPSP